MQQSFTLKTLKQEIRQIGALVEHKVQQNLKKTNMLKEHLTDIHADSEFLNHESDWLLNKLKHISFVHREKHELYCYFNTSEIKVPISRRYEFVFRILIEECLNSLASIKKGIHVTIQISSTSNSCNLHINSQGMYKELQRLESIHQADSRLMKVCKLLLVEPKIEYNPSQGSIIFEFSIHEI